jgi:hypothetical protein
MSDPLLVRTVSGNVTRSLLALAIGRDRELATARVPERRIGLGWLEGGTTQALASAMLLAVGSEAGY